MNPYIEIEPPNLGQSSQPPELIARQMDALDEQGREQLAQRLQLLTTGMMALQKADRAARIRQIFGGE